MPLAFLRETIKDRARRARRPAALRRRVLRANRGPKLVNNNQAQEICSICKCCNIYHTICKVLFCDARPRLAMDAETQKERKNIKRGPDLASGQASSHGGGGGGGCDSVAAGQPGAGHCAACAHERAGVAPAARAAAVPGCPEQPEDEQQQGEVQETGVEEWRRKRKKKRKKSKRTMRRSRRYHGTKNK